MKLTDNSLEMMRNVNLNTSIKNKQRFTIYIEENVYIKITD